VPSTVVQQLLNILQAANVQAVKVDRDGAECKPLTTSLLFADGATGRNPKPPPPLYPLPPPAIYVGDYLVLYTSPGGETAWLTRAQAQVIDEFWDLGRGDDVRQGTTPLGCCTDKYGVGHDNVTKSDCACPPNQSWAQGPCGGYEDRGRDHAAAPDQLAGGQGKVDCG
jgi:hypothetical protein